MIKAVWFGVALMVLAALANPVYAGIADGLEVHYSMEDDSGTDDSGNGRNLTEVGVVNCDAAAGRVNNGCDGWNWPNNYFVLADAPWMDMLWAGDPQASTTCVWVYLDSVGVNHGLAAQRIASATNIWQIGISSSDFMSYDAESGGWEQTASAVAINVTHWHYICWVYPGNDTIQYYKDGVYLDADAATKDGASADNLAIGANGGLGRTQGNIDEFSIWNRSLNETEINCLYNSHSGVAYSNWAATCDGAAPPVGGNVTVVDIISPADNDHNNDILRVNFLVGNMTGSSCNLTVNGSIEVTKTVTVDGTYWINYTTPSDASYGYNVTCGNVTSSTQTYFYDTTPAVAALNANNFFLADNSTVIGDAASQSVLFNMTLTDNIAVYGVEINITRDSDGLNLFGHTNITLSGASQLFTYSTNVSSDEGDYTVNVTVWDSHTVKEIPAYDIEKEYNKLTFDGSISVEGVGATRAETTKLKDRYSFSFDYNTTADRTYILKGSESLTYLPDSIFPGHFVDWDAKKWVDFEGLGMNPTVEKVKDGEYSVTFESVPKQITFNSIGGLNWQTYTYQYHLTKNIALSWVFPSGGTGQIDLGTNTSRVNLSVTAEYRNRTVFYLYNESGAQLDTYTVTSAGSGTAYFNWSLSSLAKDVYYVNATHYDQYGNSDSSSLVTLRRSVLDNCSASTNITAVFTFYNENAPLTQLTTTATFDVSYWNQDSPGSVYTYNVELTGGSAYNICLAPSEIPVQADLYLHYETTGGFTHRYYLYNHTFNNVSQGFSIYNYNYTTGVSDLRITARNRSTYNYYPNVVAKLLRFYPAEDLWRTIQMDQSGDYGLLHFDIIEETIDYQLKMYDTNNNLLSSTNALKFACDADTAICDLTYSLEPFSGSTTSPALTYSVDYNNETGNITLTFEDTLALTTSVRMIVTKESPTGSFDICDETVSAASGSIVCDASSYTGSVFVRAYSSASPEAALYSEWVQLSQPTLSGLISVAEGALWTIGFSVAAVGFGLTMGPVVTVVLLIFSLILALVMGLFGPLTLTFVVIAAVMGIALAVKLKR